MKMQMAFINREDEMEDLRNYLSTPANSILFLYGPKSSGKTTLLYRLFEQLEVENKYEINFLNLRRVFLTSYNDFIDAFFKSGTAENDVKTGTRREYSLFGFFKLDAFTEKMLKKKQEDPFLVMEQEFKRLRKKGVKPVIIIDEFHKLDGLYLPDKQKRLMVELMNFFVAMTKESQLCHVIIASSDAFFIEQVYVDTKLRKTSKFMELDYLEKDDVVDWLANTKKYNDLQEYSLDEQQVETIWNNVGGSTWEIYYILAELFIHPFEKVIARIRRERVAMIADWIFRDASGDRRLILEKFVQKTALRVNELDPQKIDVLRQAVSDNILYYNPVEAVFGIQGKSLELGIKGYFNESIEDATLAAKA